MTSKWLLLVGFGVGLLGCASDDNAGAGGGDDTLPKRGEKDTDPTIVSAVARCECPNNVCLAGDSKNNYVTLRVDSSDPMGVENLGTVDGMLAGSAAQGIYSGSSYSYLNIKATCMAGQVHTVGLTVSNNTGGVTTASVKLTIAP